MGWIVSIAGLAMLLTACAGQMNRAEPTGSGEDAGHKLYYVKCAKCHKLYDPAKYSDEEWSMWMKKMKKKAKLTDEQQAALSLFIENNFRAGPKKPPPP